jgi:hypothetical protein
MKTKILSLTDVACVTSLIGAVISVHASTDYGPAIWTPPCNANYYTSGNGHKFHVVHDMEGYYLSVISSFASCGTTSKSVHYLVNGKQDASSDHAAGEVTQMIRDANYAWHIRCWNTYCTCTEHEGFASNPAWYTEAMYQASAGVTAHEANLYGYPKDRNHIVGHNAWQNAAWKSYAGPAFGIDTTCNTHTDPGPYWDWSHYMNLVTGNNILGGPDAVSRYSGNIEMFTRSLDSHLKNRTYANGTWSGWNDFGAGCTSDPGVVCMNSNRLDVFWRGSDGTLNQKTWTASGGWAGSISLGGQLIGGPTVCSLYDGRIDVFCRGTQNALEHMSWTSTGWSGWESLGGTLTADPAAIAWQGGTRIDVFVRDTSSALNQKYWTSTGGWSGWNQIGGQMVGSPCAITRDGINIDVFCRGTQNALEHISWTPTGGWAGWESLGGILTSDPGCCSWNSGRLDVFLRGANATYDMEQITWTSTGGWSGWTDLGN